MRVFVVIVSKEQLQLDRRKKTKLTLVKLKESIEPFGRDSTVSTMITSSGSECPADWLAGATQRDAQHLSESHENWFTFNYKFGDGYWRTTGDVSRRARREERLFVQVGWHWHWHWNGDLLLMQQNLQKRKELKRN
jgi:hypothetical protein